MLRCAAVYLHNAQLLNLCGARLLNRLDTGRATVVELDLREVRFGSKGDICSAANSPTGHFNARLPFTDLPVSSVWGVVIHG